MTELKKGLPALPARFASLPIDERGFPVPWFVAFVDGKPDFRLVGPGKMVAAHNKKLCWLCGQKLGQYLAFVIGPMCAVNRITSEPPSHLECAQFAAIACPFLTKPGMRRNEKDVPAEARDPAGLHCPRNPGVTCIWVTRSYNLMRVDNGVLVQIHDPERVEWWREGRTATLEEVNESIATGLPALKEAAEKDGPKAVLQLADMVKTAIKYLPAAEAA